MKVTFSVGSSGRSYFEKFLTELSNRDKAVILAVFRDIQRYGLNAKGCELRVLHSYKKQGQKAPMKELEVARKRLKETLNEN